MAREQKDRDTECSDYSQYYDSFPSKSYDEILAARRKANMRRKGCLLALLVALILIAVCAVVALCSGSLIVKRIMSSMAGPDATDDKQSSISDSEKQDSNGGFSLIINSAGEDDAQLITTYDVSGVVKKAQESVVGIVSESYSEFSANDSGSGIIMSSDGYIVTNNHVISDGDSITVVLSDGTNCPAYLIGADPLSDIAVLKVPCSGLSAAEFGDSSAISIGEAAIAIGNPGGIQLQGTVTAGIISATDRKITVDNNIMNLIQTDASINPGNSGGPLLNRFGQVIGVTSVKITASGYEGLGFAIPINTVKPIVEELVANGYVSGRPLVGVSVRTVSQLAATFYGLPRGLLVDAVAPSSSVAEAGLVQGDIITHFNGTPVKTISDACTIRNQFKSGDLVSISYYRSGTVYDVEFALDEQQSAASDYDF